MATQKVKADRCVTMLKALADEHRWDIVRTLLGIEVTTRQVHGPPVLGVLASWMVTLPCAALLAAGAYWVAR